MKIQSVIKQSILGLVGAAAITASIAGTAFATDVTQVINGNGNLSASIANAAMTPINYSNTQVTTSGSLGLAVDDPRGTSAGWNVTIASSSFVYAGASSIGQAIPSTGFSITSVGNPVYVAGQPINVSGPLAVSAGAASLNTARKTITAGSGSGSGQYTQALPVSLVVPAYSQAGTYTAVLTISITTGP